jgi:hypothetical protein
MIADCERALGRPEQAVRMLNDPDARRLDAETYVELLIVVAGARRDLGQLDAALTVLARGGLDRAKPRPGAMRLWYAYADGLYAAGRTEDAAKWFAASAALPIEPIRRSSFCAGAASRSPFFHRRRRYPQIAGEPVGACWHRRRCLYGGSNGQRGRQSRVSPRCSCRYTASSYLAQRR